MRSRLAFVLTSLLAAGCLGSGDGPDLGPRSSLAQAQVDAMRTACAFPAGTLPGLTLPAGAPIGSELPIDNVVIIMFENRSFDHLLSDLPALGQPDVEVATAKLANKDSKGVDVPFHHLAELCFKDTNHEWQGSHVEWNGGNNDGFVIANEDPDGSRAMGFYDAGDTPFLHGLATAFAIADHYHCSLLGPTWPNRHYLYAATSRGVTSNLFLPSGTATLMKRLDEAKVDWREYYEAIPGTGASGGAEGDHLDAFSTFYIDAQKGQLAPVVLLDPNLVSGDQQHPGAGDDFHPPADVQLGDQFLDKVINALIASPQWKHMAVFVTFDENGGLYDHVPPPAACPPDDSQPSEPGGFKFDRLGFRVPLFVISPYARPHYVSHRRYDHTSITRFVESCFLLPALTARDANADPLYDLFDFDRAALLQPPALAKSNLDQAKLTACQQLFPASK